MRIMRAPSGALAVASLATAAMVIALTPGTAAVAGVPGTVGFYSFNDGTLTDNSGHGNNGTPSAIAPAATSSGFQGGGMDFSAANDEFFTVPINLSPSANPQMTFGGWFQIFPGSVLPGIVGLISNDTGSFKPTIDIDNRNGNGNLNWSAFDGSFVLNSDVQATAGVWTFVAAVYNQSLVTPTVTLYVDTSGNGSGLTSVSSPTSYNGAVQQGEVNATVGRNPNFDNPFNGTMDNVFFVANGLTASQIQTIDSQGQAAFLGGPSTAAPEPGSLMLLVTGGLSLAGVALRRRRRAA